MYWISSKEYKFLMRDKPKCETKLNMEQVASQNELMCIDTLEKVQVFCAKKKNVTDAFNLFTNLTV